MQEARQKQISIMPIFTLNQLNGEPWKSFDVDAAKCDKDGRIKCSDLQLIILDQIDNVFLATEPFHLAANKFKIRDRADLGGEREGEKTDRSTNVSPEGLREVLIHAVRILDVSDDRDSAEISDDEMISPENKLLTAVKKKIVFVNCKNPKRVANRSDILQYTNLRELVDLWGWHICSEFPGERRKIAEFYLGSDDPQTKLRIDEDNSRLNFDQPQRASVLVIKLSVPQDAVPAAGRNKYREECELVISDENFRSLICGGPGKSNDKNPNDGTWSFGCFDDFLPVDYSYYHTRIGEPGRVFSLVIYIDWELQAFDFMAVLDDVDFCSSHCEFRSGHINFEDHISNAGGHWIPAAGIGQIEFNNATGEAKSISVQSVTMYE